jgi:hypothetical protein
MENGRNGTFIHSTCLQANGIATPSFTSNCLDTMNPDQDTSYQELIIKETAAAMYSGES